MAPIDELASIFKAYDVRGVVPDELNRRVATAIGYGFARFALEETGSSRILIGRDMRSSGPDLIEGLIDGISEVGLQVVDIGLCSTDLLYFASGSLDAPGVMLTASHNPARYNGMKFCLDGARPVGDESGLRRVHDFANDFLASPPPPVAERSVEHLDLLDDFSDHVHSFVDLNELRALRVVADTANGMGGLTAPRVFRDLPFQLDVLYGELDGTFPNHPADPIQQENLVDLRERVLSTGADVGLAFDGDADRVFLVDDRGVGLNGSITTAIVARAVLEHHPGATVLYNCICSKTVPEVIKESGGVGVRTRVGHSYIKEVMAETGAIFGGEHSGHYYFRGNYRADSGIIAALVILEELCRQKVSLSELRRPFERYAQSGEINTQVADTNVSIALVRERYEGDATIDLLDGLTVDLGSWWFNLRPSNTEPLLRLNVEAGDSAICAAKVEEVTALIQSGEKARVSG